MKKLVLTVVATAVVVAIGVQSVRHYEQYQNKQAHEATVAAEAETKRLEEERRQQEAKEARLKASYERVRIECEKGLAAYENLTPFTQTQTPRPVCGPAVVQ